MLTSNIFSPTKQSRYEKSNDSIGFTTFQLTTQMNKRQLADYRKDVLKDVMSREPFVQHKDKQQIFLNNWNKPDRSQFEQQISRKSPKKSRTPGGLNYDEIFSHKDRYDGKKTATFNQQSKFETIFSKQNKGESYFDTALPPFPKPIRLNTQSGSGYKESPQKSQQKLERFKSWDNKLELQLQLQNKSISSKIVGEKPSFYKYLNDSKNGLFEKNYYSSTNNKNKASILDNTSKQQFSLKDAFSLNIKPSFQQHISPQNSSRNAEKFPLTDIIRMTSHFSSLSTQEINAASKGYIQELNNLQQALQRVVKSAKPY